LTLAIGDKPILGHDQVLEAGEWSFRLLGSASRDELGLSDDLAIVVPNLTLSVNLLTSQLLWITFGNATIDCSVLVNDVTGLVDDLALQGGQVSNFRIGHLVWLGVTLHVAVFVNDISILIDSTANKSLRITLDNLSNSVALFILNPAILDNNTSFKASKRTFGFSLTLVLRDELTAADDFAGVVPDLALVVTLLTGKLLSVTLDESTDGYTIGPDDVALLVDRETVQDREIWWRFLLLFWQTLCVANNITTLVNNISILVNGTTDQFLGITFDELTDLVLVLVLDVSIWHNDETFQAGEWRILFVVFLG